MSKKDKKISDFAYEQMLLGEITPETAGISKEEAAEHLAELEKENEEFLKKFPADMMSKNILQRHYIDEQKEILNKKTSPFARIFTRVLAPMAAGALALLLVFGLPTTQSQTQPVGTDLEITRTKGDDTKVPSINIYRNTNGVIKKLENLQKAAEGDSIQMGYVANGAKYGMIFSVDGRDSVTLHFPEVITESTVLENKGEVLLTFAYKLDDAPEFERFYFISSEEPFEPKSVLENVNSIVKSGNLRYTDNIPNLEDSIKQSSLVLIKEEM